MAHNEGEEERMAKLILDDEEAGMLRDILDGYLSDLRMEIADTDSQDFREILKRRKAFLGRLLEQL